MKDASEVVTGWIPLGGAGEAEQNPTEKKVGELLKGFSGDGVAFYDEEGGLWKWTNDRTGAPAGAMIEEFSGGRPTKSRFGVEPSHVHAIVDLTKSLGLLNTDTHIAGLTF